MSAAFVVRDYLYSENPGKPGAWTVSFKLVATAPGPVPENYGRDIVITMTPAQFSSLDLTRRFTSSELETLREEAEVMRRHEEARSPFRHG